MNNGGNHDPLAGDRLGEYVLLKRLGGELATVYKAWHTFLKRPTVLKLFSKDRVSDSGAFKRFQRETTVAGLMHHPNVVQAYDAREIDGQPILGMEYIDGLSLAKLADHGGPLGLSDACEAAQQVAMGLHHIDQLGLVHRDIKPSNLMLARDGRVKIIDLGLILIRRERTAEESEVTPVGEFVGSADYCAPEQIADCHNVDVRADLYGLGCTIFKLLTGFSPLAASEFPQVSDKSAAQVPRPAPPIRQVRKDVPRRLAAVIDRLLAQNPQNRFGTAAAAAAAFSRFTSGSDLAGRLSRVLERMEMHLNPDDLLSSSNRFGKRIPAPRLARAKKTRLPRPIGRRRLRCRRVTHGRRRDGACRVPIRAQPADRSFHSGTWRSVFKSALKHVPPGRPRPPTRKAAWMALHFSSGASWTGPDPALGHSPVRSRCASAHAMICSTESGGSALRLRTPRCSAKSFASEEPPGKPRRPLSRAFSTERQSKICPSTRPDCLPGHLPVRPWCSSAHARIACTVRGG